MTGRTSEFLFGAAAGLAIAAGLAGVWPRAPHVPPLQAGSRADQKASAQLKRAQRMLEGETKANAALRKEIRGLRGRVSELSGRLSYQSGAPVVIQIQPGMTIAGVADRLVRLGLIGAPEPFMKAAEGGPPIRAGAYAVFRGEPAADILRTITSASGG